MVYSQVLLEDSNLQILDRASLASKELYFEDHLGDLSSLS